MNAPTARVLDALREHGCKTKKQGKEHRAQCPGHESKSLTLAITEGDDGCCLLCCHAGCPTEQVLAEIGLKVSDLFDKPLHSTARVRPPRHTSKGTTPPEATAPPKEYDTAEEAIQGAYGHLGIVSTSWSYHDAKGNEVGRTVRWDEPDGRKEIRPVALVGGKWRGTAMRAPRLLYRLPEVLEAETVWVCEGEKAADAVRACGLTSTTSSGGSSGADHADMSVLRNKRVIILPDNDAPGAKYAAAVERRAREAGALEVVTLNFSEWFAEFPSKGDAVDVLDLLDGNHERLAAMLESMQQNERENGREDAEHDAEVECERLEEMIFKPFPADALPWPFNELVKQGARELGCDPSLIALPLLSGLAAAIGNSREIFLTPEWSEPPILWTAVVSESGTLKTPAQKLALGPVLEMESEAAAKWEEEKPKRIALKQDWEDKEKAFREAMRKKAKAEQGIGEKKHAKLSPMPPEPLEERRMFRRVIKDTTSEAMLAVLSAQPRGLLTARDELAGWLGSHGEYKQGGADAARWLETYDANDLQIDRKGDPDPLHIRRAAICITGGIQPAVFREALTKKNRENGLAARLLISEPPDMYRPCGEAGIDDEVKDAAEAAFRALYRNPVAIKKGRPIPVGRRFSGEAHAPWTAFVEEHRRVVTELHGHLRAAYVKLIGATARIALVIDEVRIATEDGSPRGALASIPLDSLEKAIRITDFFRHEARRFYAEAERVAQAEDTLRLRARATKITEKFGGRCSRNEWRRMNNRRTTTEAQEELQELVDAGLANWEEEPSRRQGGRPSRKCVLSTLHTATATDAPDAGGLGVQCAGKPSEQGDDDDWMVA